MEVVLLLVGIAGVALIVLPRLQRRADGSPRPARRRSRRARRGRRTSVAPAAISSAPTPAVDIGGWDDDLGWENVETSPPAAREAWDEWRATESPLAGPAEPAEPEAPPELPSVERWRAKAQEPDWVEDDDGLGWEGRHEEPAPFTDAPPRFVKDDGHAGNGNGHAAPGFANGTPRRARRLALACSRDAPCQRPRRPGTPGRLGQRQRPHDAGARARRFTGDAPAIEPGHFSGDTAAPAHGLDRPSDHSVAPDPDADVPERDWTRRDEAAALGAADVALSDDDWDDQQPTGREWGAAPATATPAPAAKRRPRIHPVLALGVYAVVGIGLVVLAATALLGGSGDPAPTAKTTPKPVSTPALTGSVVDDAADEEATAAVAAAARKARGAYRRERAKTIRARAAAVADARAAARREARAKARARERARDRARSCAGPPTRILARTGGDPRSDADRLFGSVTDVHAARRVAELVAVAAAGPRL